MKLSTIITLLLFIGNMSAQAQVITDWQPGQIHETGTNDFDFVHSKYTPSAYKNVLRVGVQSLGNGVYHDSLITRFDKIVEYHPLKKDTIYSRYFHVIFGSDTLSYREKKPVVINTYGGRTILEVESQVAPHQRFGVNINGLDAAQIAALTDSMQHYKTSDSLLNNEQTCLFYALNCLLDAEGVNPAPVITRNTNFTNGYQLNAFFNHILNLKATYKSRYSVLKKVELPPQCVLVFQDADKNFIHAVYYRKDRNEYYSKNGFWCPVVVNSIRPMLESYKQAAQILVYCWE